jgi:hypothetical protein
MTNLTNFTVYRDAAVVWGFRITSAIIVGIFLLSSYWLVLDRSVPTKILYGEVIRYEPQADGAWLIIIRWHGERKRSCWGNSKRWITDNNPASIGLVLPLEDIAYPPDSDRPRDGKYEWEVPIHVPAYFATTGHIRGAYKIRILYACNPLQEYFFPIVVDPPPVSFELPVGEP